MKALTTGLAIYQTASKHRFYPIRDTENTLDGEWTVKPAGTAISIVQQGKHDKEKYLVQADDGMFSWIWADWIEMRQ